MLAGSTATSLLSGGIVGFSLGLVGGGGSILATPLMIYAVGLSSVHTAIGTSAVAVAVNAYLNLLSHARSSNVNWRYAIIFAATGLLGALFGSTLGKQVDGQKILFLFGFVMIAVGALMLKAKPHRKDGERPQGWRTDLAVALYALAAGSSSGFFGIGGGFLIMPCLVFSTGMPTITAIGSSLLAVGVFGTATAINYAVSGWVDWPVAGLFIMGGVVGGLLGLRTAITMSRKKAALNRIFATLIFIVAAYVLYRSGASLFA